MAEIISVRHSELADFRQCPLLRHLKWTEGWSLAEPDPKSDLGTKWHLVLAVLFTEIKKRQATDGLDWHRNPAAVRELFENVASVIPAITADVEQQETLVWMLAGYAEAPDHGVHPDWIIDQVEASMVVPLYTHQWRTGKIKSRKTRFELETHVDLIVRDRRFSDRLVIVDHKSASALDRQQNIDLNDQLGLYQIAVGRYRGEAPLFPMLSQSRTTKLKRPMLITERYALNKSWRSEIELAVIENDAVATAREMTRPLWGEWPRSAPNPRQCSWKCDFLEAHIAGRRSGWRDHEQVMKAHGLIKGQGVPTPNASLLAELEIDDDA